jgi:hypothetical protein
MADKARDDFTGRLFAAINGMLLDMLAALARKDYDERRRRQAQGIAKATAGLYKVASRIPSAIVAMLEAGSSWNAIQAATAAAVPPLRGLPRAAIWSKADSFLRKPASIAAALADSSPATTRSATSGRSRSRRLRTYVGLVSPGLAFTELSPDRFRDFWR